MNFKDDLGFQAFQEKVLKWKEIFVQGINHPHDLGEARAEALTWEDIIFKGKLDAVDFCFLSDKAMSEAGSFDDRAKYFLHKLPVLRSLHPRLSESQDWNVPMFPSWQ